MIKSGLKKSNNCRNTASKAPSILCHQSTIITKTNFSHETHFPNSTPGLHYPNDARRHHRRGYHGWLTMERVGAKK